MKGIILAGGMAKRLYPLTLAVSKQLLPVYDKPMIYYPLSTLMLGGIKDIMIITNPENIAPLKKLLGAGLEMGIKLCYKEQLQPRGLPDAYLLAEEWIGSHPTAMILGDNLFHGTHFQSVLRQAYLRLMDGRATVFGSYVSHPERFGVPLFKKDATDCRVARVLEKPDQPPSQYAITGLYYLTNDASRLAKSLVPSARGELEIADLLNKYCDNANLWFEDLGRGFAWLDTGTVDALYHASAYVQALQWQQGTFIGDPYEVAWRRGWISQEQYVAQADRRTYAGRVDPSQVTR